MGAEHVVTSSVDSPVGWAPVPATPGAWTKQLVAARRGGDGFRLWRMAPGATLLLDGWDDDRFLVLSGPLSVDDDRAHRGDYLILPPGRSSPLTSADGALLLQLTGPRLGPRAADVFGPSGWFATGPGQWARFLLEYTPGPTADERVVGLCHMEPGSFSARHPHRTAHRFLFLAGAADDEVVHPDGRRESGRRGTGDFVDYPTGIEHQTYSHEGCTLLFVHEALTR